ncbi:ABC transporter permease [Tepidiphilus succinatimandens]|uniref:ABC transporter permease n=1 Tax=Tepidiphilus succinatimandens TaxID=224436 RepID=UPI00112F3FC5|nr:FtsX-like permease family protein [Tepidiphilus succinatimandens]
MNLRITLRLLRRDLRTPALAAIVAALALAVAAVGSVLWLNDRLGRALMSEAGSWLGGDALITANRPWRPEVLSWLDRHPELERVQSVAMTSILRAGERWQLSALRAIPPRYPLRGRFLLRRNADGPEESVQEGPAPGDVWVDEALAGLLGIEPGDEVRVGRLTLRVSAIVRVNPEHGGSFLDFLPESWISLGDLPASGLLGPGVRAQWRVHLVGPAKALSRVAEEAQERLGKGEEFVSLQDGQPAVKTLLEQTQRFLRLAVLAAVALAAVAVGLATRRFVRDRLDVAALLRCLGASRRQVAAIVLGEFVAALALALVLGAALGLFAQQGFAVLAAQVVETASLPSLRWWAAWPAGLLALLLAFGFAVPQLVALAQVTPLAVLRRDWGGWRGGVLATAGAGALALFALTVLLAGETQLALGVFGGLVAGFALLLVAGSSGFAALRRLAAGAAVPLRLAWRALGNQKGLSALQAGALALGLAALWLLAIVRGDLLEAWRFRIPPDAPNRFLINVQADQMEALRTSFAEAVLAEPRFWPMVRGARLVAIDGAPVSDTSFEDPRAQRLMRHEFNLSYGTALPEDNRVVAGRWHGEAGAPENAISVEEGLAQAFGLRLGSRLRFVIDLQEVEGVVTSIRRLRWESMNVNFFVVTQPALLESFAATWITSYRLPPGRESFERTLVERFPNVTVIDVGRIREQFERMSDRVAALLQAVFAFTLGAGALVLAVGWMLGQEERRQRVAVLRALGARRRQILATLALEFATLGAVGALVSVVLSAGLGLWLAASVFRLEVVLSWGLLAAAAGFAVLLVAVAGMLTVTPLLRRPPLEALRSSVV